MTPETAHVPPHNLEADRSTLGAILLHGAQALEPIVFEERLRPEDFYRQRHELIYTAMLALAQRREPIDHLTVCAQLTQQGTLEAAGLVYRCDTDATGLQPHRSARTSTGGRR